MLNRGHHPLRGIISADVRTEECPDWFRRIGKTEVWDPEHPTGKRSERGGRRTGCAPLPRGMCSAHNGPMPLGTRRGCNGTPWTRGEDGRVEGGRKESEHLFSLLPWREATCREGACRFVLCVPRKKETHLLRSVPFVQRMKCEWRAGEMDGVPAAISRSSLRPRFPIPSSRGTSESPTNPPLARCWMCVPIVQGWRLGDAELPFGRWRAAASRFLQGPSTCWSADLSPSQR